MNAAETAEALRTLPDQYSCPFLLEIGAPTGSAEARWAQADQGPEYAGPLMQQCSCRKDTRRLTMELAALNKHAGGQEG